MLSEIHQLGVLDTVSSELTWNQRVHAVHRDELFGQRVGNTLVVHTRAWDSADGFTGLRDASDCLGQRLADDTPPICMHSNLQSRVSEDGWGPFHCVDLCHESTVDNACLVEDLITCRLLVYT